MDLRSSKFGMPHEDAEEEEQYDHGEEDLDDKV
jgi:hypothetical protein